MTPRALLLLLPTSLAFAQETAQGGSPEGRLQGQILDQRGEPVPGAEVFVTENRLPLAVTRADGSGTFLLTKVPFGELEVHASAPGRSRSSRSVTLDEGAATVALELLLSDGDALRGRVLGKDGAPVAGATVMAKSLVSMAPTDLPPVSFRWLPVATEFTTTGADGRYAFEAIAIGRAEVTVLAAGHASGFATCTVAGATDLDFALEPGAPQTVQVRLRGASPALLAGAECLLTVAAKGRILEPPLGLLRGPFALRGDFLRADLPSDLSFREYRVRVAGAAAQFVRAQQLGDRFVIDFECEPGPALLRGGLRGADGQGLPGRKLKCALPDGGWLTLVTDHSGAFAVPTPFCRGDLVEIALTDPALALPAVVRNGRLMGARDSLRAAYDPSRSFVLQTIEAARVVGHVLDGNGNPVAGAPVALVANPGQKERSVGAGHTDGAGRYAIGHVDPAIPIVQVRVQCPLGTGASEPSAPAELGTADVPTIRLRDDSGAVRGVLQDARGAPLVGVVVCLARLETLPEAPARRHRLGWTHHAATDREGRFVFRRVPPGEFQFAWCLDSTSLTSAPRERTVEVATGKVTTFDFQVR